LDTGVYPTTDQGLQALRVRPEGGRACSGFVLEHQGFRVVLDLGYGTLPRLLGLLGSPGGEGIDAEVIDLRSLSPLDMDTVLHSVKRTSRALIVHEAVRQGGSDGVRRLWSLDLF
jgi:deoxyxylulose-5-phosphate synthase